MPSVKRWIDWANGAVSINLDGPKSILVRRRNVKWKWIMVAATPLPWCPICGSIVPPKAHKYKGDRAMDIHESVCWGLDEEWEEDEQLALEEGQDDGDIQQET